MFFMYLTYVVTSIRSRLPKRHWCERH